MTDGMLVVDESAAYAVVPCVSCGSAFACNPNTVPSVRVEGVRQAICSSCMVLINEKRKELKLPAIEVLDGAYAPCPLSEL